MENITNLNEDMNNSIMSIFDVSDTDSNISDDSFNSLDSVQIEDYDERFDNVNYINSYNSIIETPEGIDTLLYPYQKRSLCAMVEMEETGYIINRKYQDEKNYIRCITKPTTSCNIKTNIGIYSDNLKNKILLKTKEYSDYFINIEDEEHIKVGKTLTIISLIKNNHIINENKNFI